MKTINHLDGRNAEVIQNHATAETANVLSDTVIASLLEYSAQLNANAKNAIINQNTKKKDKKLF